MHTITSRRENTRVVTFKDLFYLWCLVEGHHCNLGCCFAFYFESIATKKRGALCEGSYMNRLAKNLGLNGLTVVSKMLPLNLEVLKKIGMVRKEGSRYVLIGQTKEEVIVHADIPIGEPEEEPPVQLGTIKEGLTPPPQSDMPGSLRADEDVKPLVDELHYNFFQYELYR